MTLNSIAVYCGSSAGNTPSFSESVQTLGKLIAEQVIKLVYGGGHVSLMGEIADAIGGLLMLIFFSGSARNDRVV